MIGTVTVYATAAALLLFSLSMASTIGWVLASEKDKDKASRLVVFYLVAMTVAALLSVLLLVTA